MVVKHLLLWATQCCLFPSHSLLDLLRDVLLRMLGTAHLGNLQGARKILMGPKMMRIMTMTERQMSFLQQIKQQSKTLLLWKREKLQSKGPQL